MLSKKAINAIFDIIIVVLVRLVQRVRRLATYVRMPNLRFEPIVRVRSPERFPLYRRRSSNHCSKLFYKTDLLFTSKIYKNQFLKCAKTFA